MNTYICIYVVFLFDVQISLNLIGFDLKLFYKSY